MISAGTIAAYLTLDISKFNRSISEAMQMLTRLTGSGELGRSVVERLGTTAGTTAGIFSGTLSAAFRDSAERLHTAAQSYVTSMSDASVRVSEKADAAKQSLLSIGDAAGDVRLKSQQVASAFKSPLENLDTSAYNIMSNVGLGLSRGLSDKKSLIVSAAKSIADSVTGTLKSVLRIASPSKVMRQIGEQTVQGLALGLASGVSEVGHSADTLARTITDRPYQTASQSGAQADIASIAGRLEQMIALLSGSEQVMQVDGRTFARLIREYS